MTYQHPHSGHETRAAYDQQWPPADQNPPWRTSESGGGAHAARDTDAGPAATWRGDRPDSWRDAWPAPEQQPWTQPPPVQPPSAEPAPGLGQRDGWATPEPEPRSYEPPGQPAAAMWVTLRNQVATTVRGVNRTHCYEAYQRFGTREALSPHGVVFLYSTMKQEPRGFRVYQVTRLALSDPAFDDAERFLSGLAVTAQREVHQARRSGQLWNPRGPQRAMVNGGDMDMPREAVFVGCALETLDTEQGSWDNMAQVIRTQSLAAPRPMTVFDLPGRAYVALTDGTVMDVQRDNNLRLGESGVRIGQRRSPDQRRVSLRDDDLTKLPDQPQALWAALTGLHDTIADYLSGARS